MYLTFHVTLRDHLIQRVFEFMSGGSLYYVTALISLVIRRIVIVEI